MKNTLLNIVRKAVEIIRQEATVFVAEVKAHEFKQDDIVTTADTKTQQHYQDTLEAEFPDFGIIGEEGLRKPGENYFTVDPLDGTKAYARLQAHGVSTLFAMVEDNEVKAAFVGDVNTGDIYGFTPEDAEPFRIRFGVETALRAEKQDLSKKYVVLHGGLNSHPQNIQGVVQPIENGGCFKNFEIMGGSCGTLCARLWIGEVGAIVFDAPYDTPWDATPLIGMNQKLGFVSIAVDRETGEVKLIEPKLITEQRKKKYTEIVTHKDNAQEILDWFAQNN